MSTESLRFVSNRNGLHFWPMTAIAGAFWAYAAVSGVLYAHALGSALLAAGSESIFAPWQERVLQYILLFPLLIGCYWWSLRRGWRSWLRDVPLQLLLALGFAIVSRLVFAFVTSKSLDHVLGSEVSEQSLLADVLTDLRTVGLATITDFFVRYGFGLALVTGADLFVKVRDAQLRAAALERSWTRAKLQALRMQLSPHALFNLLNLIKGQIAWSPEAAQKSIVQLADLLRRLLRAGDREFTRLREELEFLNLYLDLQRQRFPERLRVVMPEPSTLPDVWLPSLILQPLVENAVAHGLEGHDGVNTVALEVAVANDRLELRVRNDAPSGGAPRPEGVGLANVRERLSVHFGAHGRLVAGPAPDGGWLAVISLPLLTDQPGAVEPGLAGAGL